jgi:predicted nucleotidyltransferase
VVAALAEVSAVRSIASFGSLATGRADAYSDVDLIVACADAERTAWIAAAALRRAKPVAFFRTMTGLHQPSGRYWFEDESPFTRLDVTFYAPEAFAAVLRRGEKEGFPVTVRAEYAASGPVNAAADAARFPPAAPVPVSQRDRDAGRALLVYVEAAKRPLRGTGGPEEAAAARGVVEDMLARRIGSEAWERLARRALRE